MRIIIAGPAKSLPVITQAGALLKAGCDVTLIHMPDGADTYGALAAGIKTVALDVEAERDGAKKNAKQLKSIVDAEPYDALIAFGCDSYGAMAAKAGAAKTLLYAQGADVYDCEENGTKSTVKKSIASAAAVCAPAANIIARVKTLHKKDGAYFEAPYGVDTTLFKAGQKSGQSLCFGSVKPLEPGCGVGNVIEAFKKYCEKPGDSATLKIFGTGNLEEALKHTAANMGVADRVEFAGYVPLEGLAGAIRSFDVLVEMPPEEYYAFTALMAMAYGVPVVSSETVGATAVILNGVTGYTVKPGSIDACANRMADMAADAGARERMGKLAADDIEPVYNMQVCTEKLMKAVNYASGGCL